MLLQLEMAFADARVYGGNPQLAAFGPGTAESGETEFDRREKSDAGRYAGLSLYTCPVRISTCVVSGLIY
jgi:hypothetical protein